MVNVIKCLNIKVDEVTMLNYTEQMKVVYTKVEGDLIDFLNRCKIKGSEVMLYPCCSAVFNNEDAKDLEKVVPQQPRHFGRDRSKRKSIFNKRGVPH